MGLARLPEEFDDFVIAASPQLSRLAYRLTGNAHEADGLMQEALLRVARRWKAARDNPLPPPAL